MIDKVVLGLSACWISHENCFRRRHMFLLSPEMSDEELNYYEQNDGDEQR